MYIIEKFKRNGQQYYLIPDDYNSKATLLEYITAKQNRKREYKNVATKQYTGKKYSKVIYIVEG